MAKKTPPVEYIKDGPIMSCLQKPQLMFVRSEKSIFMTKRKMNEEGLDNRELGQGKRKARTHDHEEKRRRCEEERK